jgi:hypothetical protein
MTRINTTKLTKYGQKQSKDTLIINNGMKCPQGNIIFVNLLIHLSVIYDDTNYKQWYERPASEIILIYLFMCILFKDDTII